MPNPARLVLLLLVVAAIALLVPWTRTAPLPGDPSDTGDHPTADAAHPTRADGTSPAADAARAEPADAGLERQAAAATATAATDRHEQSWRIAVVDGATLQPIPFAELLFVDRRIDYQKLPQAQLRLARDDEEAFARAFGQRVVADASGRAELVARGFASLFVRKDQLYGELLLNPNDRPKPEPHFPDCVLVRVHPDHTLRVRTVRPGGAPCEGVVVALRVASGSTTTEKLLPPTDAEGHSQLVHTQLHLHTAAGADHEATAVAVQVCVAGQDPAPVPLSLTALPIEPVVLTLPCTGAVVLDLQDVDGTPWPFVGGCHATFHLQPLDANGEPRGLEVRDGVEELDTMDARPLLLPQVACGARYQLRDDDEFFVPVAFDGPRAAEDVVRVGMALQPHVRVLTGRLLDAARRPFVGEAGLHFEAETENGRAPLLQDEQGRFTVLLDDLGAIEGLRIVERDFRRGGPRQAVLARTEPLPPGRTDVGDVVMQASPLLLAGRVTTGPGLEVDRARLQVQFEWALADVEPARRRWLPEQHVHVVLDRSGSFEAFQRAEGRRWRVLVTGFCAPFEPLEFEPGTRDLELQVTAPSSVVAEFVHDPLLTGLDVQLWPLRPTDHDGERRPPPVGRACDVAADRGAGSPQLERPRRRTAPADRAGARGTRTAFDRLRRAARWAGDRRPAAWHRPARPRTGRDAAAAGPRRHTVRRAGAGGVPDGAGAAGGSVGAGGVVAAERADRRAAVALRAAGRAPAGAVRRRHDLVGGGRAVLSGVARPVGAAGPGGGAPAVDVCSGGRARRAVRRVRGGGRDGGECDGAWRQRPAERLVGLGARTASARSRCRCGPRWC